jgi:predicted Holliday junction resolvase-like endonuclease
MDLEISGDRLKQYFYRMNILRLAAEIFLLYILYKLIFDFIIPIYRTTKRVKKQFGEMNAKMQEQMNTYNQQQNAHGSARKEETVKKEDYIDYEEIK